MDQLVIARLTGAGDIGDDGRVKGDSFEAAGFECGARYLDDRSRAAEINQFGEHRRDSGGPKSLAARWLSTPGQT